MEGGTHPKVYLLLIFFPNTVLIDKIHKNITDFTRGKSSGPPPFLSAVNDDWTRDIRKEIQV